jgi:hypothetical protein
MVRCFHYHGFASYAQNGGAIMTTKFTKYVSTKLDKDGDAFKTNLTIDLSNLSEDDKNEIIVSAAVIKWQGRIRNGSSIPTEATYVVPRPGTKVGMTLEEQLNNLTPEAKKALIEKMMSEVN